MMRRLHFEEAQQSHFAINAARESGETRDESESASLAEEFQSLLAQLTGQIGSMPDQVSALGFALAQSAAPQRAKPEDHKDRDKDSDHDQRGNEQIGTDKDQAGRDNPLSMSLGTADRSRGKREDRQSNKEAKVQDKSENNQEVVVQEKEVKQEGYIVANSEAVDQFQVNAVEEVAVTETIETYNINEAENDSASSVIEDNLNPLNDHSGQDEQTYAALDDRNTIAASKNDKKHKELKEDVKEEDPFSITSQVQYSTEENSEKSARNVNLRKNQTSAEDNSKVVEAPKNISVSSQSNTQREHAVNTSMAAYEKDGSDVNSNFRKTADSPKTVKLSDADKAKDTSDDFLANLSIKSPARHSDEAVQTLMLRHTFDSLRAAKNDNMDMSRARTQSLAINGPGAASETKSAQGENAARGKPLTRPQITRMLERVESTLKEAARGRNGKTISLRLEPVDLGKVKVDVSLRDGALHARIAPENQQVMTSLREHAHELQGALRKLGLDVDSVSVSVTADEFSGEMATGQGAFGGSSFQDERNNLPGEQAQVAENTFGNKLAERRNAGDESRGSIVISAEDHWVA
jgi:flagellar hook-length control protein FliK